MQQGKQILSDQSIWKIVVEQAKKVTEAINDSVNKTLRAALKQPLGVNSNIDIDDQQSSDILLCDDGVKIKRQKEN